MSQQSSDFDRLIPDLETLELPGLGRSPKALGGRVQAAPDGLSVSVPLACRSLWPEFERALADYVMAQTGSTCQVTVATDIPPYAVQRNLKRLPGIGNIVAVASGKGGVGKSTTAVNLALALQAEGARVGILDADVYGPSLPRMLGIPPKPPETRDGKQFVPVDAYGLQAMSIGLLLDDSAPAVWRGPMATSALNQLLRQTDWQDLDLLIVDMPPGTGDIQLTLAQTVPVAGAVIVTTPQDVALSDARKGLEMFRKVSVPLLGIVENMSLYRCRACGDVTSLFGQGGGQKLAEQADIRLLGELPLDPEIGSGLDQGQPSVAAAPDSDVALAYRQIAISVGLALTDGRRDYSAAFPEIVVEDT